MGTRIMQTYRVIEVGTQARRNWAHSLHEERHTEQVNLLLVDEDVHRRVVREVVLDHELSREHVRAELTSGLHIKMSVLRSAKGRKGESAPRSRLHKGSWRMRALHPM